MALPTKNRIESIDILKGLVMVLMALDHVRDYFHASSFYFDPADPVHSNLPTFFTRWITHFCAPAFSFLAGISAFMVGRRKTRTELSRFLLKRGLWLIFIEMTVVNFAWYFDPQFRNINFFVIWVLGVSMIFLAGLVQVPRKFILLFSGILILGHNLFDKVHYDTILWGMLHEFSMFKLSDSLDMTVSYPLIPWIAVMALGYYFGSYYESHFGATRRRRLFNITGITFLVLFLALRFFNSYGDPLPWDNYNTLSQNLIAFFNPTKYPPSLMYLLMTLGATLVFLANSENFRGKLAGIFSTFGRVPFFYYILHLYFIHITALIAAELSGIGWQKMILSAWVSTVPELKGYGFSLPVVYVIWLSIMALMYPLCRKFDVYKSNNKKKWWLSYL